MPNTHLHLPIAMRPMNGTDRHFVAATMHKSIADCPNFRWVPAILMRRLVVARTTEWLNQWSCSVAAAETDPDVILGFAAARKAESSSVVLYCYVKEAYRRHGIARRLLAVYGHQPGKAIHCLHWSATCESMQLHGHDLRYVPTMLRDPARTRQGERHTRACTEPPKPHLSDP